MNQRIEIHFTRKDNGFRDMDVFGLIGQAVAYARLLHECGHHIDMVFDSYQNREIDWKDGKGVII